MKPQYDVIVVGGGPAGLAAAGAAWENGAKRVLLLERNADLGGILNQCIHNGFGLHHFGEELTGPEYAERFIDELAATGVEVLTGAMCLEVEGMANGEVSDEAVSGGTASGGAASGQPAGACAPAAIVHAIHPEKGYMHIAAGAVVLAMGCRERPRGAIGIPGSRPAGVFTAGAAQLYMNIEGFMVGRKAVVLGSGDIGLIMARRLTLEGAQVLGVFELMPYSSGLTRNKVQCLDDYGIPLHLSHTITDIRGDKRVEQVVVQRVDDKLRPIPGTEQPIDCDTVLLSVGLIPENELSRQAGVQMDPRTGGPMVFENMETSIPGVFACGNVAHVHDLVDFVTAESLRAGRAAAEYCAGRVAGTDNLPAGSGVPAAQTASPAEAGDTVPGPSPAQAPKQTARLLPGEGVSYTVPQWLRPARVEKGLDIFFRVKKVYETARVEVFSGGERVARFKREDMAPGEMQKITLPRMLLDKIQGEAVVQINEEEK